VEGRRRPTWKWIQRRYWRGGDVRLGSGSGGSSGGEATSLMFPASSRSGQFVAGVGESDRWKIR
jgi:hypothetical protein